MLAINNEGHVSVIYQSIPEDNIMYSAGEMLTIPTDTGIEIQPPYGIETVVVVGLKKTLTDAQRDKIAPLFDKNSHAINSKPVAHLGQLVKSLGNGMQMMTLKTFAK